MLGIGPLNPSDVDWLWSNLKFLGKCQRPHFHGFHIVMPVKVLLFYIGLSPFRMAFKVGL